LAECYSSLTALPVSPAVTPGQARRLIEENVAEAAEEIIRLGGSEYLKVLQRMRIWGWRAGPSTTRCTSIAPKKLPPTNFGRSTSAPEEAGTFQDNPAEDIGL